MIKFSKEFIEQLIQTYPACVEYHKMAMDGDEQLINALNCMSDEKITNIDIIECLEKGEEGKRNLYTRAKRLLEREDIYFKALEQLERPD
jgi:predicted Ser/Thr protein kinase